MEFPLLVDLQKMNIIFDRCFTINCFITRTKIKKIMYDLTKKKKQAVSSLVLLFYISEYLCVRVVTNSTLNVNHNTFAPDTNQLVTIARKVTRGSKEPVSLTCFQICLNLSLRMISDPLALFSRSCPT